MKISPSFDLLQTKTKKMIKNTIETEERKIYLKKKDIHGHVKLFHLVVFRKTKKQIHLNNKVDSRWWWWW